MLDGAVRLRALFLAHAKVIELATISILLTGTTWLGVYLQDLTGSSRGIAAIFTMAVVLVVRFIGGEAGLYTAIGSSILFDLYFVHPIEDPPFVGTAPMFYVIYSGWLLIGLLWFREPSAVRLPFSSATMSVEKWCSGTRSGVAQATADLNQVASTDSAHVIVDRLGRMAGRLLTAEEVGFWTEVVRRAAGLPGAEERDRLLQELLDDADDDDADTSIVKSDARVLAGLISDEQGRRHELADN